MKNHQSSQFDQLYNQLNELMMLETREEMIDFLVKHSNEEIDKHFAVCLAKCEIHKLFLHCKNILYYSLDSLKLETT